MSIVNFLQKEYWLVQFSILLVCILLTNFLTTRAVIKLANHAKENQHFWLILFYQSLQLPVRLLIWLIGAGYTIRILQSHFEASPIFSLLMMIKNAGIIVLFVWFLLDLIKQVDTAFLNNDYKNHHFDVTTVHAISQLVRVVVLISAFLIVMQSLGVPISALLAFGGAGTVVVGLAGKDLLANFFGGLMIYLDKPFKVGDWIRSPDRNIEGHVEYIGWRLTRIRTFEKRPLYVPNALFSTIIVENPSRMRNRRIYKTLNIRYSDLNKLPAILNDINRLLKEHEGIDQAQLFFAHLNELADSSIDFLIYAFTKATSRKQFQAVQEEILLKAIAIIHQHGADCAFPTRTLELPEALLSR